MYTQCTWQNDTVSGIQYAGKRMLLLPPPRRRPRAQAPCSSRRVSVGQQFLDGIEPCALVEPDPTRQEKRLKEDAQEREGQGRKQTCRGRGYSWAGPLCGLQPPSLVLDSRAERHRAMAPVTPSGERFYKSHSPWQGLVWPNG